MLWADHRRFYKALLIDSDGVLTDRGPAILEGFRLWAEPLGLDPKRVHAASHGKRLQDTVVAVGGHLGLDPEAEAMRLQEFEVQALHSLGAVALPGALRFLTELQELRTPWAVVTSACRRTATVCLEMAGLPCPSILICAEDVKRGKPDPEPYAMAAKACGFQPHECCVIEDAPVGLLSALVAGCRTLGVATTHACQELCDVQHYVAKWQGKSGDVSCIPSLEQVKEMQYENGQVMLHYPVELPIYV